MGEHKHDHDEHDEDGGIEVKLDGTMGIGAPCHLTIITQDTVDGTKETTYEIPYNIIDMTKLNQFLSVNFIMGYKIVKVIPAELSHRTIRL